MSVRVQEVIPEQLLFSRSPKLLSQIKQRNQVRVFPNAKQNGWTSNQTVEFEIRSDSLVDLHNMVMSFNLSFPTSTTKISNALDVITSARLFINDVQVEEILNANDVANLFLMYSMNKAYGESEGSVYLGLTNQVVQTSYSGSRTGSQTYTIPLSLVFGAFRSSNSLLPLFGNRLRLSFTLEADARVVSYCANTSDTYTLDNVNIVYDEVVPSSSMKKALMDAMQSDQGIRIGFTSCSNQVLNVGTSSNFYGKITFNNSNVLSLHMLLDNTDKYTREADKWVLPKQSYPFTNFNKLFVRYGSQNLTPADGIQSYTELFMNANKTISSFNNLLGEGLINYRNLVSGYTRDTAIGSGSYGICPLSIDCSKIAGINDDAIVNQGVSSAQSGEFHVELYRNSGSAFSATESLICSIVHKRALVFSSSGIMVEI